MKHYKFGYARVSTEQQNLARQLDMLSQYGVDYIFNEKMTGNILNLTTTEIIAGSKERSISI